MKILLMTPPYTAEDRYGKKVKSIGPLLLPPLGVAYIAAVLENDGHKVEILDSPIENMSKSDIRDYLSKRSYDAIGIGFYTPMYAKFIEMVREIKPVIGDTPIVVGGPHPSILPLETIKENPEIDYVVRSEGEDTTVELFRALEKGKGLSSTMGITYREGKRIKANPPRPLIQDLDRLPFPAWHLLEVEKYTPAPSTYKELPALHMITTRGCPFHCIYCSSRSIFGRVHRSYSVERTISEMNHLIEKYNVKEIFFDDDLFTFDKKHVTELCDRMIEEGINEKASWSCNTRVNLVNPGILEKMKKAGCWQIHYGVESGSQRLLDLIKKGITIEQCRKAVKITKEAGIEIRAFFMLGLPTETPEESEQTIRFAIELDPDYAKFSLTTPYPGTELFEMVKGQITSTAWEDYKTMGGFSGDERPFVPEGRTSEELNRLQREAHKRFFFRPHMIVKHIRNIRSLTQLKTYAKSALALGRM